MQNQTFVFAKLKLKDMEVPNNDGVIPDDGGGDDSDNSIQVDLVPNIGACLQLRKKNTKIPKYVSFTKTLLSPPFTLFRNQAPTKTRGKLYLFKVFNGLLSKFPHSRIHNVPLCFVFCCCVFAVVVFHPKTFADAVAQRMPQPQNHSLSLGDEMFSKPKDDLPDPWKMLDPYDDSTAQPKPLQKGRISSSPCLFGRKKSLAKLINCFYLFHFVHNKNKKGKTYRKPDVTKLPPVSFDFEDVLKVNDKHKSFLSEN